MPQRAPSSHSRPHVSRQATFAGAVLAALLLVLLQSLAASAITVTSARLPDGVAGHGYTTRLAAAGGKAPEKWSLVSGALPPALKLSAAGVISGTPSKSGSYAFTVKVADSALPRHTATRALTLSVYRALAITTASPPAGRAGVAYSAKLAAAGGHAPLTWKLTSGALPRGLRLSAAGRISGTPAAVGHTTFTVQVTDAARPAVRPRKTFTLFVTGTALPTGGALHPGDYLVSPGGQYTLVMQTDGNLVEYFDGDALWASGTGGAGNHLIMQSDGNLVIYSSTGHAVWASNTGGHSPADYGLALQSDANVVVYGPSGAVWATSTPVPPGLNPGQGLNAGWTLRSPNGQYSLAMQTDGNLVVYGPSGPLWASNTAGTGGADSLIMQTDGNLVVYQPGGHPVWASNTGGAGNYLAMQSDGNLVVYQPGGHPVWASNSAGGGGGGLTLGKWAATAGPKAASQYYGYPYPNAPQCTDGGACVVDAWKFYQGQCTSWVAYRLNQLNGTGFYDYYGGQRWGDAGGWATAAENLHIAVNTTPAVGAIAWYNHDHVAYVERVNSPTSIVISEMNYDFDNGFWVHTVTAGQSGWPTDFIHIADR